MHRWSGPGPLPSRAGRLFRQAGLEVRDALGAPDRAGPGRPVGVVTALLLAMTAGAGVYLLVGAWFRRAGARRLPAGAHGSPGTPVRPSAAARVRGRAADWLVQAGLAGLRPVGVRWP